MQDISLKYGGTQIKKGCSFGLAPKAQNHFFIIFFRLVVQW